MLTCTIVMLLISYFLYVFIYNQNIEQEMECERTEYEKFVYGCDEIDDYIYDTEITYDDTTIIEIDDEILNDNYLIYTALQEQEQK